VCLRGRDGIRRVLVVGSGHAWSTLDCQRGLLDGFGVAGFEAYPYDLHTRLQAAQGWVEYANRVVVPATGQEAPPPDWEPTAEDVIYQAGLGIVTEALRLNVDAVVVVCGLLLEPRILVLLSRAGFPVFLFGTESPYDDDVFLSRASLVTALSVNEPASVAAVEGMLAAEGVDVPVSYLPLGFAPSLHRPGFGERAEDFPQHDVVFVGNLYPSRQAFFEAVDWDALGIDLGIYGVMATVAEDAPVRRWVRHDGVVPNPVAAALYTRSAVVLNLFRTEQFGLDWEVRGHVRAEAVSPRMIEAAALGAFMVSEEREQVVQVFGELVPTFRSAEEMGEVIAHWLARPAERAAMARRLSGVVAEYSYAVRARQIVSQLEEAVRGKALTRAA
jgi:glycosyltransferase involved in cell wall biosynthesis